MCTTINNDLKKKNLPTEYSLDHSSSCPDSQHRRSTFPDTRNPYSLIFMKTTINKYIPTKKYVR